MCVIIRYLESNDSPVTKFENKEALQKELLAKHLDTSVTIEKLLPSGISIPHYVDVSLHANELKLTSSYGNQSALSIENFFL